jgi:transglutaminase-like putative cysteine protease
MGKTQDDLAQFLAPTEFLDSDHPSVIAYATRFGGEGSAIDRAVRLFLHVRDSIRYDPYTLIEDPEAYRASVLTEIDRTFCIPKAIVLAASCRAIGIPARLGFADVKNHLASPKLVRILGSDLFVFHGYADLYLEEKWVKATPAFNAELCNRFDVAPLEFDGRNDAMFHEYEPGGRRHMEYVHDRGTFADFPYEEMVAVLFEHYGAVGERIKQEHDEAFHGEH